MVSTRRQKQEDPPAPAVQPKPSTARGGRKKATATEEIPAPAAKTSTTTKSSVTKRAPAPDRAPATRTRATKSKPEPEHEPSEQQYDEQVAPKKTRATKAAMKEELPTEAAPKRATRGRATSKAEVPDKVDEPEQKPAKKTAGKVAPAKKPSTKVEPKTTRATRTRVTKKEAEESQPEVTPEEEPEVVDEDSEQPTRAARKTRATAVTKATLSKAKAPTGVTKTKVKSASKTTKTTTTKTTITTTRATRGTRSKKTQEAPLEETESNKENGPEEDTGEAEKHDTTSEDEQMLNDPFNPKPAPEPAHIKIDLAALRAPTISPIKATSKSLLRSSPSKSIMQKIAELPASNALSTSPSKLPRPHDKDEEMADAYEPSAPTPLFQRSTTLFSVSPRKVPISEEIPAPTPLFQSVSTAIIPGGKTTSLKSSLFSASARKPPGSARKFHAISPSQALLKPAGQIVDEKQKMTSSLFSTSPKKLHIESNNFFGTVTKLGQSAEEGKPSSALTASPRKVKLASPTFKFDRNMPDMSASVQRPFGKSSLNESPRRMKTPGRTPKTAPISSIRAFLDPGTPTRAPPKFTLPKQEVIMESEEPDVTMFDEPQFPCDMAAPAIEPTPMDWANDDVFGIEAATPTPSNEFENFGPETPQEEREEPTMVLTENGLNELATPALRRSDVIHEQTPIAESHSTTPRTSSAKKSTEFMPQLNEAIEIPALAEDVQVQNEGTSALAEDVQDDLLEFIETPAVETEVLPDTAMAESFFAVPEESASPAVETVLPSTPVSEVAQDFSLPAEPSNTKLPGDTTAAPLSTPKQAPVNMLHPVTMKRPQLSPRKSSLKSPEKKALVSPKKTVTWQQLEEKASHSTKPGILSGMTFFVDCRTHDMVDQSGIFVHFLEKSGAVVIPNWSSNNTSLTHVLFMNGDMRTLEKVVASNGAVKCVNIGWALACETSGMRIDEDVYLTDLSRVPGNTPAKPLATLSANSSPTRTPAHTPSKSPFKAVSTPFILKPLPPSPHMSFDDRDKENSPAMTVGGSPATPYFLHKEELIQRTAPPKQNHQPLFGGSSLSSSSFAERLAATKRRRSDVGGTTTGRTPKKSRPALQDIFE